MGNLFFDTKKCCQIFPKKLSGDSAARNSLIFSHGHSSQTLIYQGFHGFLCENTTKKNVKKGIPVWPVFWKYFQVAETQGAQGLHGFSLKF